MSMLTVAWDVDDVLNNLMHTWFDAWWRPGHPACNLNYTDLSENPPHQILGVAPLEYLKSLDEFRLTGCYEQMPPNLQVLEWFQRSGTSYRHMAITAVPRRAASVSAAWLFRHFGDWIRSFHFIPSPRAEDIPTGYDTNKADFLKRHNQVDIFIDDHAGNIREAAALGIRCFLVSRPWNSGGMPIREILELLISTLTSGQQKIAEDK